ALQRELADVMQKLREIGLRAVDRAAPGIHVLAEQRHLLYALGGQVRDLGDDVVERPRHLLAARVGHDTEAAVLAAAFHDRDEGRGTLDTRRRQVIELLDLREADVDLGPAGAAAALEQLRQPVQRLRPEHHVHVGRALDDGRPFLACDAAADGVRIETLRTWPAASTTYFTRVPGRIAVGRMMRFETSRICAPGASRCGAPSISTTMPRRWRISPALASFGMLRTCAPASGAA